MKYSDKYPGAQRGFEPTDIRDDMLYLDSGTTPCANINVNDVDIEKEPTSPCPNRTQWRDLAWGVSVPCCSEECRKQMWKDYFTIAEPATPPEEVRARSVAGIEASPPAVVEVPAPAVEAEAAPAAPSDDVPAQSPTVAKEP